MWPASGLDDNRLSKSGLSLELLGAHVADCRVPAFSIVEALDVVEHVSFGILPDSMGFACCGSVLSEEKKLSIAALSHTLPDRLIEQTTPRSAISRWNCSLVY
jgi:hypothetical protein